MSKAVGFWVALLLVFGGSFLIWTIAKNGRLTTPGSEQVKDLSAGEFAGADGLKEFELIDQRGRRVNSSEFNGQIWAASFFFSRCPSTCYQQNVMLQQLSAKFADKGFQLASITCDPGYDTPVILAGYANRFNADPDNWKFLSPPDGSAKYLSRIGNEMLGIAVEPTGVEPTHTDRVVLFDRNGEKQGAFSITKMEQFTELQQRIEALYAEQSEVTAETDEGPESEDADSAAPNSEPEQSTEAS